jgi:hypothetical protein
MEMTEADINRLNQMRLSESFDPSMLLSDTPASKIEPIGGLGGISEREAFGGPLYQMMNPSGRSIVDTLGSRGMGIGGFAAEMAFGPGKTKALGKGISSLPMSEKIMDKAFQLDKSRPAPKEVIETLVNKRRNLIKKQAEDFSLDDDAYYAIYDEIEAIEKQLNSFGIDKFRLEIIDEGGSMVPEIARNAPIFGSVRKKIRKIIEDASFFDPQKAIGKQTIVEKAKETSPISAKIIEKIGDSAGGSPGADYRGSPYFINKMAERNTIGRAFENISRQSAFGPPNPKNLFVGIGQFPNNVTKRPYNIAEAASQNISSVNTFNVGSETTPFFVDPKKLADKLTMSGTGADFFKVRGASILDDVKSKDLTKNIKKFGYSPEPIFVEITPLGYAHLSEGNHRMAKALTENYDEIPVVLKYVTGAERVNHDFAVNKLDELVATGKKGYKTPKEMKTFANKRTTEARSIKSKNDLQKDLDELQELFAQQAAKFKRAKDVEQSALRDGYLPDIEGSQKIMRNTNSYGKVLKKEMDELQKLIDNYDNT